MTKDERAELLDAFLKAIRPTVKELSCRVDLLERGLDGSKRSWDELYADGRRRVAEAEKQIGYDYAMLRGRVEVVEQWMLAESFKKKTAEIAYDGVNASREAAAQPLQPPQPPPWRWRTELSEKKRREGVAELQDWTLGCIAEEFEKLREIRAEVKALFYKWGSGYPPMAARLKGLVDS